MWERERASARRVVRGATAPAGGWRWCWKEIENIPIGPLWYSGATMPAIGRRSTKPLNDPPRRSQCAMATLFQSRKSSCPLFLPPFPSLSFSFSLASIPDAKLPHFSVLTRLADISTIVRMVMQSPTRFWRFLYPDKRFAIVGRFEGIFTSFYGHRDAILWNFYELLFTVLYLFAAIYSGKKIFFSFIQYFSINLGLTFI